MEIFRKKSKKIIDTWTKKMISQFNFDNTHNFFSNCRNKEHKINTWAIFWYAVIFENRKLCLNPTITHSENIGIERDQLIQVILMKFLKAKLITKSKKIKITKRFKRKIILLDKKLKK